MSSEPGDLIVVLHAPGFDAMEWVRRAFPGSEVLDQSEWGTVWSAWSRCYCTPEQGDWMADMDRFTGLWKKARKRGNVLVVMGLIEWLNRYDTWHDSDLFLQAKRVVAVWSPELYAERMLGPWSGSKSDIIDPEHINALIEGSRTNNRWIVLREEEVMGNAHD